MREGAVSDSEADFIVGFPCFSLFCIARLQFKNERQARLICQKIAGLLLFLQACCCGGVFQKNYQGCVGYVAPKHDFLRIERQCSC